MLVMISILQDGFSQASFNAEDTQRQRSVELRKSPVGLRAIRLVSREARKFTFCSEE